MVTAGVLDEDERVELVEGVLVEMVPIGAEHDGAVEWLTEHFSSVGAEWKVRVQSTLLTAGGYLLPDLMLIEPLPRSAQPSTALLVIEVAESSQARDIEKASDYAVASVPEYWIVDLAGRQVTVHREPSASAYGDVHRFHGGQTIMPLTAGAPPVDVSALLG